MLKRRNKFWATLLVVVFMASLLPGFNPGTARVAMAAEDPQGEDAWQNLWFYSNPIFVEAAAPAEGGFDLTIMHTNDTHAHLDDIARRATVVNEIRPRSRTTCFWTPATFSPAPSTSPSGRAKPTWSL